MAFTVMPWSARSRAAARVNPMMPALDAPYAARSIGPMSPAAEAMFDDEGSEDGDGEEGDTEPDPIQEAADEAAEARANVVAFKAAGDN